MISYQEQPLLWRILLDQFSVWYSSLHNSTDCLWLSFYTNSLPCNLSGVDYYYFLNQALMVWTICLACYFWFA
uniref:Uncharacterized protein n=1 Tax=Rhizophora mucronata TaxID=61149 RepID=A0A2P2QNS0_RHIMU